MRGFVAVHPEPELRARLVSLTGELAAVAGRTKWVEPENLHVTLRFLGDVSDAAVDGVRDVLRRAAAEVGPFRMDVVGVGAFPSIRRPQTVWAGIRAGQAELQALYRRVEAGVHGLGFAAETRGFTAHLTLGRRREEGRSEALTQRLEALRDQPVGTCIVRGVSLMKSVLSNKGPVYSHVIDQPLG